MAYIQTVSMDRDSLNHGDQYLIHGPLCLRCRVLKHFHWASANDLAGLGFCAVAYPWILVELNLKSIRETLGALKGSFLSEKPPTILSYADVCDGVGFNKYYELEESDQYEGSSTGTHGHQFT